MISEPTIVVVGSLNADFVVRVPRFLSPGETLRGERFAVHAGGKGGNQACAASRLGGRVVMIGQVGADAHGAWLRDQLAQSGTDVGFVAVDDRASSGVAMITTDGRGENEIVIVAGANGTFTPDRLASALPALRRAAVVLLQLEIPLATVELTAAEARAAGAVVLLDPAPAMPIADNLLRLATIVTPNETELALLAGHAPAVEPSTDDIDSWAHVLLERGATQVLVKMGRRGARLVARTGTLEWPAFDVTPVDTTAAGDAFNGALAVALAARRELGDAVVFACAAAAVSVTRDGAQSSMPTRAEVDRVLRSR